MLDQERVFKQLLYMLEEMFHLQVRQLLFNLIMELVGLQVQVLTHQEEPLVVVELKHPQ
jgi:hypothetical protein